MTDGFDALPPLLTADVGGGTFLLRLATQDDLRAIVGLLPTPPSS